MSLMPPHPPPQLHAWIEELRVRLERGGLADVRLKLIEPFYEVMDLQRWVRSTLREVDRWKTFDEGMEALYYYERLHTGRLLRRLHERLNGRPVTDEEIERERERRDRNCIFGLDG